MAFVGVIEEDDVSVDCVGDVNQSCLVKKNWLKKNYQEEDICYIDRESSDTIKNFA